MWFALRGRLWRGKDPVLGVGLAAHVTLEAVELPRGEDLRERRMHWHLARVIGLRRFHLLELRRVRLLGHELAERRRHVVTHVLTLHP
jgi:hypothetical protein